jgi:Fe-only nitrogenase accessory protein AnfO
MTREIAVFRGRDGLTAALGEPGTVAVYRRRQGKWEVKREAVWELDTAKGLRELRRQLTEILGFLGACKVFVARAVTGLPYYEMEKSGIGIWEVAGAPNSFLTEIALQDAVARKEPVKAGIKPVAPREVAPGHLAVSIKEIQEQECGVTSKQVLLPLLRRKLFLILEIECNHLPPWLEAEIVSLGLAFRSEKLGGNHFRVIINQTATPG